LVLSDVGDGIHGDAITRQLTELPIEGRNVDSAGDDADEEHEHDELVVDEEPQERFPSWRNDFPWAWFVAGSQC
jgi:hypothetical protein